MNGSRNNPLRQLLGAKGEPMKQVEMPKVAICVASGDMVHTEFAACMYQMGVLNGAANGLPFIPTAYLGVQGSLVVRNRNECIEQAQKLGVDYVLFLDSDMVFPGWTLRRLLSHEKDIVGGTYLQRNPPHNMLGIWAEGTVLTNDRIHAIDALPAGCLLIKLSVFDKMAKPYFRTPAYEADEHGPARIQGEDYYFCEQAAKLGHQIWLDVVLTFELGHMGKNMVKPQIQPQMMVDAVANHAEVSDGQAAIH